jgi:alkaline phosphatase D
MPIRELPTGIFRVFRFGGLADLILLDTRLAGRDEQGSGTDEETANAPDRSLLGEEQEAWLFEALSESLEASTHWRVVAQQVVLSPLRRSTGEFNPDSWDGYRESRRRLLDFLADESIDDVIFLTGDVHSSWGIDVPPPEASGEAYDPETGAGARAVELVAPAVSSRPLVRDAQARAFFADTPERLPFVRYMNLEENGYGILDLTPERAMAQWFYVDTVSRRSPGQRCGPALVTRAGASHLERIDPAPCDL